MRAHRLGVPWADRKPTPRSHPALDLRYAEVARRAGGLLSIRLTPDKGRGVFAERPLGPGHRLFAELPIVLTPNPPLARSVSHRVHHSDVCFNCMRSLAAPSQALAPKVRTRMALPLADRFWPRSDARTACTSCKSNFCSPECQQSSHSVHARLCKHSSALAPILDFCNRTDRHFPLQTVRMYAHLIDLYHATGGSEEEAWNASPLSNLASSLEWLVPGDVHMTEMYTTFPQHLKAAFGADTTWNSLFTEEAFTWLYNISHLNCSTLLPRSPYSIYLQHIQRIQPPEARKKIGELVLDLDQSSAAELSLPASDTDAMAGDQLTRSVGSGLFAFHSVINHSCAPNCQVTFPRSDALLEIVATSPVGAGEEITIDYLGVHNTSDRDKRMTHLKQMYGWTCRCALCAPPHA